MSIKTSTTRWFQQVRRAGLDQILLVALVAALPFEHIPSTDIAGITIRPSLLIGAAIIVRAGYQLLKRRAALTLGLTEWLLVAFSAWIILLIPFALNVHRAIEVTIFTLFVIALAAAIKVLYRPSQLPALMATLTVTMIVVSLFGLYQYFGNLAGISSHWTGLRDRYSWQLFGFPRIQSVALEPLYFASYLLLPLSLLISATITRGIKRLYLFAIVLGSLNLFLTVSRGGTLAYVLITCIFLLLAIIRREWRRALIVAVAIIAAYGLTLLLINKFNKPLGGAITHKTGISSYSQQLQTTGLDGGGDERAQSRSLALNIFKQHPLAGVGPGNYGPAVQGKTAPASGWVIVNNETLELAAETGIIGLGLVVIAFITLFVRAFKTMRASKDPATQTWIIGLSLFVLATAIQYQTFSTLYIVHIWTALGLLMALTLPSRETR